MPSEALSVSSVAAIQPAKAASPTLDTLPKLDLSPWKERFSKLVEETPYRPKSSTARPVSSVSPAQHSAPAAVRSNATSSIALDKVLEQWQSFIETLERSGKSRLASHLRICQVEPAGGVVLNLRCPSRIVFETLLDELPQLCDAASSFYGAYIAFEVTLDKAALTLHKEARTLEERFQELAGKNALVRYLIEQFGAELSY
ncbi:MAG: hypothetical protein NZM05_03145 [Chloroherpetonaceae bacterium]|nr:hypothetical protein [Chloroherpetonaceae bacterium]